MKKSVAEVDKNVQQARHGVDASPSPNTLQLPKGNNVNPANGVSPSLERHHSNPPGQAARNLDSLSASHAASGPVSSRTRRALHMSAQPTQLYEPPDEQDELRHDAVHSAQRAAGNMDRSERVDDDGYRLTRPDKETPRYPSQTSLNAGALLNPYPTPSPSAKRNGVLFNNSLLIEPATPLNIAKVPPKEDVHPKWPTPPYEENEWAAAAAASIFAASSVFQ